MLTDLFLFLLILWPFEGRNINFTDSIFPSHGEILQNDEQLSSNWSFMAVIVYGKRVLCAGTAFNEKWLITLAHCVHGNLMEESVERFGSMSVRLGAAPISYKEIKEVEIKSNDPNESKHYVPVVELDELLPVYNVVVHPEYIYKENYQIFTRLAFVGVNDLALVNFKKGPTFSVPSLVLYPDFSGWCMSAGWDLSMSEVPMVRKFREFHFHIGNNHQCQPYLDISADEIPNDMKEGYKKNKICSLHSGDVYLHGFEDFDGGGPLICDNRLQGILSHNYKKTNEDYFTFFYDLAHFITWIREQIFEVEELYINRKGKGRASIFPTTTITITTTTTTSRNGTARIFLRWEARPDGKSEITLNSTTATPRKKTKFTRWTTIFTGPTATTYRRKFTTARFTTAPTPRRTTNGLPSSIIRTNTDVATRWTTIITRSRTTNTSKMNAATSSTTKSTIWTIEPRIWSTLLSRRPITTYKKITEPPVWTNITSRGPITTYKKITEPPVWTNIPSRGPITTYKMMTEPPVWTNIPSRGPITTYKMITEPPVWTNIPSRRTVTTHRSRTENLTWTILPSKSPTATYRSSTQPPLWTIIPSKRTVTTHKNRTESLTWTIAPSKRPITATYRRSTEPHELTIVPSRLTIATICNCQLGANVSPRGAVPTDPLNPLTIFLRNLGRSSRITRPIITVEPPPRRPQTTPDLSSTVLPDPAWYKQKTVKWLWYFGLGLISLLVISLLVTLLIKGYRRGCRCKIGGISRFFR